MADRPFHMKRGDNARLNEPLAQELTAQCHATPG
jgi:hypothetical protein